VFPQPPSSPQRYSASAAQPIDGVDLLGRHRGSGGHRVLELEQHEPDVELAGSDAARELLDVPGAPRAVPMVANRATIDSDGRGEPASVRPHPPRRRAPNARRIAARRVHRCARMKHRLLALLVVAAAAGLMVGAETPPGTLTLRDGEVLGPDNWQKARGLLPDEILEHYRLGEYRNTFVDLARPELRRLANAPDFVQASRANRDRYGLDEHGSLADLATAQRPTRVFGLPFPDVEVNDPQGGTKVVWNNLYSNYYRGDSRFLTEMVMLGRRGVERKITTDVLMRTYDGSLESAERDNPDDFLVQTLARVVAPADLAGTNSLTWRYRAGDRPDALWSYVPGLRRPRQVNPLNRSDGFLGSDISLDDGPFFDGKPESFTFRLLGRTEMLVLIDPFSLRGEIDRVALPGGGWRMIWQDVPRMGADQDGWSGLPWAPVSAVLGLRPVWIVEATPRDPNYLYGRLVLRIDAETYRGAWVSKYDRAGTPVMSYQVSMGVLDSPDGGKTWLPSGGITVQTSENLLYKRATAIAFPPRDPRHPADYRIPTHASDFSMDVLVRTGR